MREQACGIVTMKSRRAAARVRWLTRRYISVPHVQMPHRFAMLGLSGRRSTSPPSGGLGSRHPKQ
jgi:hypothetical protein